MATGRIGTTPVLQVRWSKAPSAGTTSLSGLDDNSVSLVYSVGYEAVYQNGVLLSRGNDYTATNGTTITLTTATVAGDIIEVFANQTIPLADTYSQTVANGKFINNTLTTTTGDIIYASAANTPARLGIGSTDQVLKVSGGIPAWGAAPSPSFKGALVYINSNQSVSNSTDTYVTFAAESFDTDSFHDNSTNNTRLTIPTGLGGKYLFTAIVGFDTNTTGRREAIMFRNRNTVIASTLVAPATGNWTQWGFSQIIDASAGDYFELRVFQNSGGSLNLPATTTGGTTFACQYLGA
jgi:hypothetical protein